MGVTGVSRACHICVKERSRGCQGGVIGVSWRCQEDVKGCQGGVTGI